MLRAIRQIRARKLSTTVERLRDTCEPSPDPAEVAAWQLERFNALWAGWRQRVPYFADLAVARQLPVKFASWAEVRDGVPVMNRRDLQEAGERLRDRRRPLDYWRTTGGSTAEPVQLPAWNSERTVSAATMWYARSWFGVSPADPLFLLWGHSHLFGGGLKGRVKARIRMLQDRLLGYTRWSAYDLSPGALRKAGACLLARKPAWVLGYSTALDRFAKVNEDRGADFRELNLKLVVATAEAFPGADSAERIERVFGCPVRMEYGAVETGVIAHQPPEDDDFRVFWRDHVVEMEGWEDGRSEGELLVTSLFPRACPLVRYRLGDLITAKGGTDPRLAFARVAGRCNDAVQLADGKAAHSEGFTHVVKDLPAIDAFQVHQDRSGAIVFRYLARDVLAADAEREIRRRLRMVDASLEGIELKRVEKLEQTVAGKTRSVICELQVEPGRSAAAAVETT